MAGFLPFLPVAACVAILAYYLFSLKVNYDAAKKSGLRLIVMPFDSAHPLWMLLDRKVTFFFAKIPFLKGSNFIRFNWRGWDIRDRYKPFQELGDALLFVTPGKLYLQLCDAEAVASVLSRPKDFARPIESVAMLQIFGPNLGTADGPQWQKHRKITASAFNEHVYKRVWSESIQQATAMVDYWSLLPKINTVPADCRMVSLHVLSGTAFSQSYAWQPGTTEVDFLNKEKNSQNYANALRIILDRCLILLVLGQKNLSKPWLPKIFKELNQAVSVFQQHMTDAYEHEKAAMSYENESKKEHNLMTSLVCNSQDVTGSAETGLTEQEIYGNIFVYNFAGHDATANTLSFCIYLMATQPDTQDWIAEEINHILAQSESGSSTKDMYEEIFPRLKRCLAVTHEVVRLYTAVGIAKAVGSQPQPLIVQGKTYMIPPNTFIIPSYAAMHTHPRYWGNESLKFQPSRWIESVAPADASTGAVLDAERFKEAPKNNSPFVGWSGGIRNCPGRKFSQVEIVGVLVGLFRFHKVEPVREAGETEAAARQRLLEQVRMEAGFKLLLQILHPEKLVLQWKRR